MSGRKMNDGMNNPEVAGVLNQVCEEHTSGAKAQPSSSAPYGTTEVVPFQNAGADKPMTLAAVRQELKAFRRRSRKSFPARPRSGSIRFRGAAS